MADSVAVVSQAGARQDSWLPQCVHRFLELHHSSELQLPPADVGERHERLEAAQALHVAFELRIHGPEVSSCCPP